MGFWGFSFILAKFKYFMISEPHLREKSSAVARSTHRSRRSNRRAEKLQADFDHKKIAYPKKREETRGSTV